MTEHICPSCHCSFKQEFLCTTCGAEKLKDEATKQLERALHSKAEALMMQTNEIERLRSLLQNGSPVVEGVIQHMAMEIANLKKDAALLNEATLISAAYDFTRATRVFAADDIEYDLFAAGWKAAIDAAMKEAQ